MYIYNDIHTIGGGGGGRKRVKVKPRVRSSVKRREEEQCRGVGLLPPVHYSKRKPVMMTPVLLHRIRGWRSTKFRGYQGLRRTGREWRLWAFLRLPALWWLVPVEGLLERAMLRGRGSWMMKMRTTSLARTKKVALMTTTTMILMVRMLMRKKIRIIRLVGLLGRRFSLFPPLFPTRPLIHWFDGLIPCFLLNSADYFPTFTCQTTWCGCNFG